jgi:hypothetical protein
LKLTPKIYEEPDYLLNTINEPYLTIWTHIKLTSSKSAVLFSMIQSEAAKFYANARANMLLILSPTDGAPSGVAFQLKQPSFAAHYFLFFSGCTPADEPAALLDRLCYFSPENIFVLLQKRGPRVASRGVRVDIDGQPVQHRHLHRRNEAGEMGK